MKLLSLQQLRRTLLSSCVYACLQFNLIRRLLLFDLLHSHSIAGSRCFRHDNQLLCVMDPFQDIVDFSIFMDCVDLSKSGSCSILFERTNINSGTYMQAIFERIL